MGRALAWGAGIAGVLAALLLRRRRPVPSLADPAAELRRKLAAARAEPDEAPAPEPPAAPAASTRRREVHEGARAAIDEMRGRSGTE